MQLGAITLDKKYLKEKPTVDHYRVFGAIAYVFKNKQQRPCKLDTKSFKGYFTDYSYTSKAYRFWDPLCDQIIESSDFCLDKYHRKYIAGAPPDPRIHSTFSMDLHFANEIPSEVSIAPLSIILSQVAPDIPSPRAIQGLAIERVGDNTQILVEEIVGAIEVSADVSAEDNVQVLVEESVGDDSQRSIPDASTESTTIGS
jgi:hypothetical protein